MERGLAALPGCLSAANRHLLRQQISGNAYLSDNNTSSKRMQHIATQIAFLREAIQDKHVVLYHIRTSGQVADIFTKPLGAATFHTLRSMFLG